MRATRPIVAAWSLALLACLALAMLLSLGLGSSEVSLADLARLALGHQVDPSTRAILLVFRLPRVLLAALVGASLSLCGLIFQVLTRNPLAEPFILGVSGGAALGAVLAVSLGLASLALRSLLAFGGALGAVGLVLGLARRRGGLDANTLILSGVMVNAFFTAVIMYLISITTDQKLHAIMCWLYGDLSAASLAGSAVLAPVLLAAAAGVYMLSREMNLLAAGDESAAALGVGVARLKTGLALAASLLAGIAVSVSGLIGFVGLMIPHLVRLSLGQDHRLLLPVATLGGALFLVLADTVARLVISPAQLPVGVITAALGAPFFLLLLARKRSPWW